MQAHEIDKEFSRLDRLAFARRFAWARSIGQSDNFTVGQMILPSESPCRFEAWEDRASDLRRHGKHPHR